MIAVLLGDKVAECPGEVAALTRVALKHEHGVVVDRKASAALHVLGILSDDPAAPVRMSLPCSPCLLTDATFRYTVTVAQPSHCSRAVSVTTKQNRAKVVAASSFSHAVTLGLGNLCIHASMIRC